MLSLLASLQSIQRCLHCVCSKVQQTNPKSALNIANLSIAVHTVNEKDIIGHLSCWVLAGTCPFSYHFMYFPVHVPCLAYYHLHGSDNQRNVSFCLYPPDFPGRHLILMSRTWTHNLILLYLPERHVRALEQEAQLLAKYLIPALSTSGRFVMLKKGQKKCVHCPGSRRVEVRD